MNCQRIIWESRSSLGGLILNLKEEIKRYQTKLKNPVHTKTGKPLAASTIKQYEGRLILAQRELKNLENFKKSLLMVNISDNEQFPIFPGKYLFGIARDGHDSFYENLIRVKDCLFDNRVSFNRFDLSKMVNFIFNSDRDAGDLDMVLGIIICEFKKTLEHIIDENKGNQPRHKSKVKNLFPTLSEEIELLDKRLTEIEWKRSKIFSSEPVKKSRSHLRVVK